MMSLRCWTAFAAAAPLYRTEEIAEYLSEDVQLLLDEDAHEPSHASRYRNILEGLQHFSEAPTLAECSVEGEASEAMTLRRLSSSQDQQVWTKIIKKMRRTVSVGLGCTVNKFGRRFMQNAQNWTQPPPVVLLEAEWEAESCAFSDSCDFSAALRCALDCFVPETLRALMQEPDQETLGLY